MTKKKLVIEMEGGVVQEVYADDPALEVVLVDWDSAGADSELVIKVKDSGGKSLSVWAAKFPFVSLDRMPVETCQAAEQAK
jgi:hypothetical protein